MLVYYIITILCSSINHLPTNTFTYLQKQFTGPSARLPSSPFSTTFQEQFHTYLIKTISAYSKYKTVQVEFFFK